MSGIANAKFTLRIGSPIISGSANSVLFIDSSGQLAQNPAALLWDNSFLAFRINGDSDSSTAFSVYNNSGFAAGSTLATFYNNANGTGLNIGDSGDVHINFDPGINYGLNLNNTVSPVGGINFRINDPDWGDRFTQTDYGKVTIWAALDASADVALRVRSSDTFESALVLQEWGNSVDVSATMTDDGQFTANFGTFNTSLTVPGLANAAVINTNGSGLFQAQTFTANRMIWASSTTALASAAAMTYATSGNHLTITSQTTTTKNLLLKGIASQSVNAFEIQDSASTTARVAFREFGRLVINQNAALANNDLDGASTLFRMQSGGADKYALFANGAMYLYGNINYQNFNTGFYYGSVGFTFVDSSGSIRLDTAGTGFLSRSLSATAVPLTVRGAAAQSANLSEWQDSASAVGARVNSNRDFSRPNGSQSEQFGAGAVASTSQSTAIGNAATVTAVTAGTAVGFGATVAGATGTAIGWLAACNSGGAGSEVAIGRTANTNGTTGVAVGNAATTGTGSGCIAIGGSASATAGDGCIAIGLGATITGSNGANIGRSNTNTGGFCFGYRINDCGLGDVTFSARTDAGTGSTNIKVQANRAFATELTVGKTEYGFADTSASWKGRITHSVQDSAGYREGLRIEASGSVAMLGFYGATAIVKPSSTTDLRQALIDLGLYTTGGATPLNLNQGTISNARITPRVTSVASSATPTPSADTDDLYKLTALATAPTFAAPTGTPVDGQKLMIRIKDNGTARALAWNAIYAAGGSVLPTTTVANKLLHIGFVYDSVAAKYYCVAAAQEA